MSRLFPATKASLPTPEEVERDARSDKQNSRLALPARAVIDATNGVRRGRPG